MNKGFLRINTDPVNKTNDGEIKIFPNKYLLDRDHPLILDIRAQVLCGLGIFYRDGSWASCGHDLQQFHFLEKEVSSHDPLRKLPPRIKK